MSNSDPDKTLMKANWRSIPQGADLQGQREALVARIEHYIKNKLQGIYGGNFLIESGLKEKKLDTVSQGWQIVGVNQSELIRCVSHLSTLGKRFDKQAERVRLPDLVQIAVDEFESVTDAMLPLVVPTCQCATLSEEHSRFCCFVEPSSVRSALYGLLRICAACCRSGDSAKVQIEYGLGQDATVRARMTCHDVEIVFDVDDSTDRFDDPRLSESFLIEWEMAEFAILNQGGELTSTREGDRRFVIEISFPASPESV